MSHELLVKCAPAVALLFAGVALAGCGLFADDPALALTAEAAGADAVWLHVAAEPGTRITLSRGTEPVAAFTLAGADTTLADEGLTPATAYTWTARDASGTEATAAAATLARSSHAVTWTTVELGSFSGLLYDVAVVAPDDIWVVGEINERTATGELDPVLYNAAHWDGTTWTSQRLQLLTFCEQTHTGPYAATSVLDFGDELWVSAGDRLSRFTPSAQQSAECIPASALSMWGSSPSVAYAVGSAGTIARYDGGTWRRVESGVAARLTDVHGTGALAFAAGPLDSDAPTALLRLAGGRAESVPVAPFGAPDGRISGSVYSIWADGGTLLTLASDGVFRSPVSTRGEGRRLPGSPSGTRVRGTAPNDVFVVGRSGVVSHFDGVAWHSYSEVTDAANRYVSVSVTADVVVAVGYRFASGTDYHGLVATGRR